jgi:signal transduction histidine kinase
MTGLRPALWVIAAVALIFLTVETELIASSDFHQDRGLWVALNWVIGGGFVATGLFAWYRRPDNRVGLLMVATGFAWFVSMFRYADSSLPFTLGLLLDNAFIAVAIHLLLAFPSGRLSTGLDRALVWTTYGVVTVAFLPYVFALDPSSHYACDCPENLLLVDSDASFAKTWLDGISVIGIALMLGVLGRLVGRWRAAAPPLKRVITPVFIAGSALMAMVSIVLLLGLLRADESVLDAGWYATLIPFGLVPYLFLATLVRSHILRGGAMEELVARIRGSLGDAELRDALARALNDPSLELAYWIPERDGYVDPAGHPVELPKPGSGWASTEVTLRGQRVAALIHDPMLLDEPGLVDAVGAAAALALEKERLDAELRAKVEQLRWSRARLVSIGLAERRRLERDLHDGAQQRLVSLALDLRMARDAVRRNPDQAERLLDGATEELGEALEELRELARGIHPAVLSDRGLDPAVEALASRLPLPVEVQARLGERVPEPVELAAYFVVAEALTNVVKYAGATHAAVRVGRENGRVVVEVADDGVGGADPSRGSGLRGLADRVSALGGKLEIDSSAGAGTKVIASIPCE